MIKWLTLSVLFVFGTLESGAQEFPSELWYLGELRLKDGTRLKGNLMYNLEKDIVQLEREERIETYSAQQVISFVLTMPDSDDEAQKQAGYRYFFSLPLANNTGYKRLSFFEVVVEGKATLLVREYITMVTDNTNWQRNRRNLRGFSMMDAQSLRPNTRRVLAHKMYLGSLDGKIREIPRKRRQVLYLFRDHEKTMKKYIKAKKLKLDRIEDMARFFIHYNKISSQ